MRTERKYALSKNGPGSAWVVSEIERDSETREVVSSREIFSSESRERCHEYIAVIQEENARKAA
jgi:hypothetical protein